MSKSKHNTAWSTADKIALKKALSAGKTTQETANELGRTVQAVWCKKHEMKSEGSIKGDKKFSSSSLSSVISEVVEASTKTVVRKEASTKTVVRKEASNSILVSIIPLIKQYSLKASLQPNGTIVIE